MGFMPAWGGLAPWGQAAAIVILLYVFASIIIGVVLTAIMMFLFAWLREKVELLKKLRPAVDQVNEAMLASQRGEPLPPQIADNKLVQVVAQVPKIADSTLAKTSSIEQKVDYGSQRVADAVIEFRARTEMVKGMARAFFLPGLTKRRAIAPAAQLAREQIAAPEPQREEQPMEQEIVIRQSFSSTRS
jgi:hypothetical protein